MNYSPLIGILIWGVMIVSSLQLSRRAIRALSAEDKARLVDLMGTRKGYGILVVLLLVVAWYVAIQCYPEHRIIAHILLMCSLLGFALYAVGASHRRMNRLGFPKDFQHSMLIASVLRVGALFVLAISVLWPLLWHSD